MTVTLEDAAIALNTRMRNATDEEYQGNLSVGLTTDAIRKVCVGTDLTYEEIFGFCERFGRIAVIGMITEQVPLEKTLAGLMFQGILIGQILAEMRANEDRAAAS